MSGLITHKWDGTILTITSDSGTSSADLKGEKGDDGIRGPQGAPGVSMGSDGNIDLSEYATKDYVDDAIANIEIPEGSVNVDLTDYATKSYVDNAISNIDAPNIDLTGYATEDYVDEAVANAATPSDEQVSNAVNAWLNNNPDATTTVADGSITEDKLADNSVTPAKTTFFEAVEVEKDFRENLFDDTDKTYSGKIISSEYSVSKKITISSNANYNLYRCPVEGGKTYVIQYKTTHTAAHTADVAYIVDENDIVLARSKPNATSTYDGVSLSAVYPGLIAFTINSPANGYLVFGYRAATCSEIMVSEGTTIAEYVAYGATIEKEYVYDFTSDTKELIRNIAAGSGGTYYNCQAYGVTTDNADNTAAMQALIDKVYRNGGGVIWIPVGTYLFSKDGSTSAMGGNARNNIYLKSNVSILGESMVGSVFKLIGETQTGCSMFGAFGGEEDTLMGCSYSNFTVDLSEQTMASYTHKGKAFYVHGIRDCIFRDLRLISTPSTAMGIDMLDNVTLDSIYVYQGGRQWAYGGNGGAGIGIGTGLWENENYIIRNCICDSCGHFGIFLEDQGLFKNPDVQNFPKGQIITNNIIRNGRHYGIGIRGGKNVVVTGNNLYENVGGIYADYGATNVLFANNLIQGCTKNGFEYGNESQSFACENIVVTGNLFTGNSVGIKTTLTPTNCQQINNVFIGNVANEL